MRAGAVGGGSPEFFAGSVSRAKVGYALGGRVEHELARDVSLKAERLC